MKSATDEAINVFTKLIVVNGNFSDVSKPFPKSVQSIFVRMLKPVESDVSRTAVKVKDDKIRSNIHCGCGLNNTPFDFQINWTNIGGEMTECCLEANVL